MGAIPVVDLQDYRSGSSEARTRFSETLCSGLCEFGFTVVEGHAIDPELIRRVYAHFERFFAQDEELKRECAGVAGGQRGFTAFGVEHAKGQGQPDLKEFFHVGQDGASGLDYPANVWPRQLPELCVDGLSLFRALEECSRRLLEALAEGFALPRETFASMVEGGNSILRALHYPPVAEGAHPGSLRAAPHEDINLITLLCEATGSGLEIRPPGGASGWLPVEVAPGQIVVDSGDMLSRLTNEIIPATPHRVVNPTGTANLDRYSLPFFAHPRPECDLAALPVFVSDERPRQHPPITAGGYLAERLREIGLLP
jgi:isopenicillin N synthase-like dioxygenase